MMMYISIGLCVVGFLAVSVSMTFIIAQAFFSYKIDEENN
jgi:hypothetical protein